MLAYNRGEAMDRIMTLFTHRHLRWPALLIGASLMACQPQSDDRQTALQGIEADSAPAPVFDRAAMDALLSSAVENGDVVGVSALVYDEGEVVYRNAFGMSDREAGTPVELDTVWRIYSMTKPVMSALIMDLREDGLLELGDPVSDYIPEVAKMRVIGQDASGQVSFADQARPMTIEDLLLHRAGLAYGIFGGNPIENAYQKADLFSPAEPLSEKVKRLGDLPLVAQPGEVWSYSYSIDVLGRIAEIVTETPLNDLLEKRIFDPLGMDDTGFYVRSKSADKLAAIYLRQPDGTFVKLENGTGPLALPDFTREPAFYSGGGGLVSTLDDYAKFAEMIDGDGTFRGKDILKPDTVSLMMSNQLGEDFKSYQPWIGGQTGAGFGYGGSVQMTATRQQQLSEGRFPGQWGWSGAARTTYFADPQNDAFGILMLQFFGGEDPDIHTDFRALVLRETRDTPLSPDEGVDSERSAD